MPRAAIGAAGPVRLALSRFRRHRLAMASAAVLAVLFALAITGPALVPALGLDGSSVQLLGRFLPPSPDHPLGTDELGRDALARLVLAGRVSLFIGLATALAAATLGTAIGLLAGFAGGRLDALLMRLTDSVLALPLLPLLIVLAAVDLTELGLADAAARAPEAGIFKLVVIVTLVSWTGTARLVRNQTLAVRERDFVRAARALGAGPGRLMLVHLLPNVIGPAIVAATLAAGNVILLESALSFLGLGVQAPLPSWGNMLSRGLDLVYQAPHLAVWPGLAIFLTVASFNFLGDGLQDALDPRSHHN